MNKPQGLYFKVDMDYCADPLWISADNGNAWGNDYLGTYQDCMSPELYHMFQVYQDRWEYDCYALDTDMIDNAIGVIQNSNFFSLYLAEELKKEWPNCHIFAGYYDTDYKVVEV